jgi:His/Glu/Gln/Arg/opine family amino acid ABC transporter permease subunit
VLLALFNVNWSEYAPDLWHALLRTLEYTAASFAGAAVLGLLVALVRLNPFPPLRLLAAAYTELFKNVPLLAIIFLTYFGLPSVGITFSTFQAGAVSLILFYAAYLSEIFRSAITGIQPGQKEAAEALGLGRLATFAHVVFPQALRIALPGTNTMLVDLLKSTSLLVTIAAAEVMTEAQLITSETFRAFEVYAVIAGLYFVLCFSLSQVLLWLERQIRGGVALSPRRRRRLGAARALLDEGTSA